jgi:hypothetical protein
MHLLPYGTIHNQNQGMFLLFCFHDERVKKGLGNKWTNVLGCHQTINCKLMEKISIRVTSMRLLAKNVPSNFWKIVINKKFDLEKSPLSNFISFALLFNNFKKGVNLPSSFHVCWNIHAKVQVSHFPPDYLEIILNYYEKLVWHFFVWKIKSYVKYVTLPFSTKHNDILFGSCCSSKLTECLCLFSARDENRNKSVIMITSKHLKKEKLCQ